MENEAQKPIGLTEAADNLETRIREHPLVMEWVKPLKNGDTYYPGNWVYFEVDPVNVIYKTKEIETAFQIVTKTMWTRVVVSWSYSSWRWGITDIELTDTISKALGITEYLWNNHIGQRSPESMETDMTITIRK